VAKITKNIAETWLGQVPQGKEFWCQNGQVFNSLPQLGMALRNMDQQTFLHHCNKSKNDFSNWVRDVIGDDRLALELLKKNTQAKAAKVIEDRVSSLRRVR